MWVFTKYGFYSAVCARQGDGKKHQPVDPARVMVRARVKQHLENLLEHYPTEFGGCEITATGSTDYRFRIFIAKEIWAAVLARLASETDYDNFKSAVGKQQGNAGQEYLHALHEVWDVMHGLQK